MTISSRIGIIGGGQLGKMIAQEAKKMGFYVAVIDPTPNCPAAQVVDKLIVADFQDEAAIRRLAKLVEVLTFEIESANSQVLEDIASRGLAVHPSAQTLTIIKDKLLQKKFFRRAKLPVAEFIEVENKIDILKVADSWGYPLVLKARFDAYDGRGNAVIRKPNDVDYALSKLSGHHLYLEKFIKFKKELAVMVARSTRGEIAVYPVVETIHKNNICHIVKVPAPISNKTAQKAKRLARETMKHLKGAGVFGIEMFQVGSKVLINEIAPRVHNSGHYSIEAAVTSQFEQHLRAICGLPLGSTKLKVPAAVMINILGRRQGKSKVKGLRKALAIAGVSLHIYGKHEVRPQRKMGHITVVANSVSAAYKKAILARKYISI